MSQDPSNVSFITSDQYDGRKRRLYQHICSVCGASSYIPKHCLSKRKYCSPKCSNANKKISVYVKCGYCDASLERNPSQLSKSKYGDFYCNREHKELAQSVGRYSYRTRALDLYEAICAICGYNAERLVLDVHHIDRDRDNGSDENLIVLCPTCHALITRKVKKLVDREKLVDI